MYEEHPCFISPKSDSALIWRYMNFQKFESILNEKAIFFAKAIKFEDPYEGLFSEATMVDVCSSAENCEEISIEKMMAQSLPKISKDMKELVFVNCWHMSKHESAAMWKLYAQNKAGIAIQSNFEKLKACFSGSHDTVFIGKVRYIDWNNDKIPRNNYFYPYLYKRKSFECERELRALVYAHQQTEMTLSYKGKNVSVPTIKPLEGNGKLVTVSLETLIEKVYVSPKSSKRFENKIKKALKQHDLNIEVIKSDLYKDPIY